MIFAEVKVKEEAREDIDWESYLGEYSSTASAPSTHEVPSEAPSYENFISSPQTLFDHLSWQWGMVEADGVQQQIACRSWATWMTTAT